MDLDTARGDSRGGDASGQREASPACVARSYGLDIRVIESELVEKSDAIGGDGEPGWVAPRAACRHRFLPKDRVGRIVAVTPLNPRAAVVTGSRLDKAPAAAARPSEAGSSMYFQKI